MTKEKYKEYIQNSYDDVLKKVSGWHELANVLKILYSYDDDLKKVSGWHELANVLKILSDYISNCIDTNEDIYNDKDIDYLSYLELNELIDYKLKEVCRIVKKG